MFHAHFVSVFFLTRSDSQPFCASVFYGSSLVTVLLEKRWLQAMTCDFQGRGEQGNFKQHGLPLGAVPFRALVSIMTSPIYLFTLGKPSMLPSGLVAGKFPVPATAQRSFSQGSGTLHCLFLSQPAASGPKLHGTGSLRKMCSLSLWHLCCIWHPPAGAEEHGEQWAHTTAATAALALCLMLLAVV